MPKHLPNLLYLFLLCLLSLSQSVKAQDKLDQLTVDDYLQQARLKGLKANRLITESSPYLLQHAYNPVNWYAWGEEAFEKARKENKPIFLSIGYSTCHWCHVMAHESFENKEIAKLLNQHFVSIKVDREQRPDIDSVYMAATQLINGNGGWPMTVFLDHRLRPFHAAVYYPPYTVDGHIGLKDVLLKIDAIWHEDPERVSEVAASVTARIKYSADDTALMGVSSAILNSDIYQQALTQIAASFDEESGGFSAAPKFPRPGIFAFLAQYQQSDSGVVSAKADRQKAKAMMKKTLEAMAAGGIHDQIGGGFHRYSVDSEWQMPHFEKMLYTQALMMMAYADYYRLLDDKEYKSIVYRTVDFLKREMRSPLGGYYSALGADSVQLDEKAKSSGEKKEGAYYLWSESALRQVLSQKEFAFIKQYYAIAKGGNIHSDSQEEFGNLNILFIDEDFRNRQLSEQQAVLLQSARTKLNEQRRLRPRPQLDDKIITAWNGMLISALVQASTAFDDKTLLEEAIDIIRFSQRYLYDKNHKELYRHFRQPHSGKPSKSDATLADYVWLIDGLLRAYSAGGDPSWLQWAQDLQKQQDVLFLDKKTATYFEASAKDKNLLFRSRSIFDNALPSANAIALSNLRRFATYSKKAEVKQLFTQQADRLVNSFAATVNHSPAAAAMLLAMDIQYKRESASAASD